MKQLDNTLLTKLEVALVYLFGSKALKVETPLSDTDIGIVFFDRRILKDPKESRDGYNQLYDLFASIYPDLERAIDLIFLQQAPIALQYDVVTNGKVIYEASSKFRANYEERVINEFLDFKPILNYFDSVLLERIA